MSSPNAKGRPRQDGPSAITAPTMAQHPQDATAVRAAATFLPPSGRRTLGVLIVQRCPFCAAGHVHRGKAGVRQAGCGRGEYLVVPRTAAPAQHRGAA